MYNTWIHTWFCLEKMFLADKSFPKVFFTDMAFVCGFLSYLRANEKYYLQIKCFPKCFLLIWLLCAAFCPIFLQMRNITYRSDVSQKVMAFVCGCNCASDIVVHRGIGSFHRKWFPIPQYECQKKKHSLLPEFKIFF